LPPIGANRSGHPVEQPPDAETRQPGQRPPHPPLLAGGVQPGTGCLRLPPPRGSGPQLLREPGGHRLCRFWWKAAGSAPGGRDIWQPMQCQVPHPPPSGSSVFDFVLWGLGRLRWQGVSLRGPRGKSCVSRNWKCHAPEFMPCQASPNPGRSIELLLLEAGICGEGKNLLLPPPPPPPPSPFDYPTQKWETAVGIKNAAPG